MSGQIIFGLISPRGQDFNAKSLIRMPRAELSSTRRTQPLVMRETPSPL